MRIGLYGGTFNPAHAAHAMVSRTALRRLQLDRLWWIVTPGNPLKTHDGLPSQAARMAQAAVIADDPRVAITGFEARAHLRYTCDAIAWLHRRCPGVRFVWIMGADNLAQFHRWQHWESIAALLPIAVIDRQGETLRAMSGRAARVLAPFRRPETQASHLAIQAAPAFVFLHGPRSALSSTQLREGRARQ